MVSRINFDGICFNPIVRYFGDSMLRREVASIRNHFIVLTIISPFIPFKIVKA